MLQAPSTIAAAALLLQVRGASELPDHDTGWRHLVLINNTRGTIAEIYVSDDGVETWQEDMLGAEFLLPGSSVAVYVDDQNGNCRVDVKVVLDNGSTFVNHGFNACQGDGRLVPLR